MTPLGDTMMAMAERRVPAALPGVIPRQARRREPHILPLVIDEDDSTAISPRFKEYPEAAAKDVQASGSNEVASGMGEVDAAATALAQLRATSEHSETGTSGHPCVGMGVVFASVGRPPSEFSPEERTELIEVSKRLGTHTWVSGGFRVLRVWKQL